MMKIIIHGKKVKVTNAINDYIENKIGKLDKYLENPNEVTATVSIRVKGKDQTVEVTIPVKRYILRAEDTHNDLYAAIDLVTDKLERQIRKNKTRLSRQNYDSKYKEFNFDYDVEIDEDTTEEEIIVKRKNIEMKPMDEEEAILEMNLLGHEFFVYKDMHTNNICVLYKRKDGNYGLIETK